MSEYACFRDVLFDLEPLGLADAMVSIGDPIKIIIESDSPADLGLIIHFGLSTSVGEIMETSGKVCEVRPIASGFSLLVEVMEVDAAMQAHAVSCLKTGEKPSGGGREPIWGIGLKQTDNTFAVLVNSPAGVLSAVQLSKLGELAARGSGIAKLTHAQRVILFIPLEKTEEVRAELASVGLRVGVMHKGVRNVRACCGTWCRFSRNTDAISTALAVDKALYGRGVKFDIKIAISGCRRNCSESYCCDIGLIGGEGKYQMVVGGRGSHVPFRALKIADGLSPEIIPAAIAEVIDWYEKNAREDERFWKLLVRLGNEDAGKFDLGTLGTTLAELSDGIEEFERFKEQLARMAGVKWMKKDISFCATEKEKVSCP